MVNVAGTRDAAPHPSHRFDTKETRPDAHPDPHRNPQRRRRDRPILLHAAPLHVAVVGRIVERDEQQQRVLVRVEFVLFLCVEQFVVAELRLFLRIEQCAQLRVGRLLVVTPPGRRSRAAD
jgi:hypothetical protein